MVTYSELDSSNVAVLAVVDRSASPTDLCRIYLSLELDRDEPTLSWGTDYHCNASSYPIPVHEGREIRWYLTNTVPTASEANEFANGVLPLCERIAAGWSIEWDGNNQRGQLTDDARDAERSIGIEFSNPDSFGDGLAYVDAEDYLLEDPGEDATVDEIIEAAANEGSLLDADKVEVALKRFAKIRSGNVEVDE